MQRGRRMGFPPCESPRAAPVFRGMERNRPSSGCEFRNMNLLDPHRRLRDIELTMNEDADTGRWERRVPKLDVRTDQPERTAGANFEHVRRAEAMLAFLR